MTEESGENAPAKTAAPRYRGDDGSPAASQTTRALAEVRKLVLRGDLRPSQRIAEAAIAARLGMSRTPMRLALARLAHEGLLEPLPAGGFTVRTFTVVEVWDAIELRAVLEGTAARLAAERLIHKEELDLLRGYAEQIKTISQPHLNSSESDLKFFTEYCELNIRFHTALMDLARSTILRRTWDQIQSIPFAAPSSTILPEAMHVVLKSAVDQHRGVIEAISRRDAAQAETIARSHAQLAFSNLDVALRSARPGSALVQVARPPLFDPGTRRAAPLKLN